MTQQKFTVANLYDAQPGRDNYRTEIDFNLETGTVTISEAWGSGTSFRLYNRVDLQLASIKGAEFANVDGLVKILEGEDAQATLAEIAAGHRVEWDGSNHVGRLTEEAADTLENFRQNLEAEFENLPTVWSADDYFGGAAITGEAALKDVEQAGSIELHAANEVASAAPEYHLDQADVEAYFHDQIEKLIDDEDLELANRARLALDDEERFPLLTTLENEYWAFDKGRPGGVTFTAPNLDGHEVTLVDDHHQCWLADSADLDEAMQERIKRPARTGDATEDGLWWYEKLCSKVRHRKDLEAAFEAEHGQRNWP